MKCVGISQRKLWKTCVGVAHNSTSENLVQFVPHMMMMQRCILVLGPCWGKVSMSCSYMVHYCLCYIFAIWPSYLSFMQNFFVFLCFPSAPEYLQDAVGSERSIIVTHLGKRQKVLKEFGCSPTFWLQRAFRVCHSFVFIGYRRMALISCKCHAYYNAEKRHTDKNHTHTHNSGCTH